ncbi:MAG: ATP-binding protein [Planctomycetota bacterium]
MEPPLNRRWFEAAASHVDAGVVIHAPDTAILYANARAVDLLGMTREHLTGMLAVDPDLRLLDPAGGELPVQDYPVVRAIQGGGDVVDQLVGTLRPGTVEPIWARVSALLYPNVEALEAVVVTFVDVTALRRAEEDRRRAEAVALEAAHLESLALLAGGVAHDFNNLLASILGASELAKRRAGADLLPLLDLIGVGAQRAGELTRQLMAYASGGQVVRELVDPPSLVGELAKIAHASYGVDVELTRDLQPCAPLLVDATQLRQVVLNLLINAGQALGAGPGQVTVRCRQRADAAGTQVLIEVQDDGPGMDADTQRRIFEPFFTTKPTGTGLGLAAVQGFVRAFGGRVELESALGQGTTFRLVLPAESGLQLPGEVPAPVKPALRKAVVVDDDPVLRRLLGEVLESAGVQVTSLARGAELLATLRRELPEVLILDLVLPDASGVALLQAVRAEWPQLPVLVCSGYATPDDVQDLRPGEPTRYLSKPFTRQQLRAALGKLVTADAIG